MKANKLLEMMDMDTEEHKKQAEALIQYLSKVPKDDQGEAIIKWCKSKDFEEDDLIAISKHYNVMRPTDMMVLSGADILKCYESGPVVGTEYSKVVVDGEEFSNLTLVEITNHKWVFEDKSKKKHTFSPDEQKIELEAAKAKA